MRAFAVVALILNSVLHAQPIVPVWQADLDSARAESSGLMMLAGQLWTILDSDNPNVLYRLDPATGSVLREVTVANATNVDWEELTWSGPWIYIGDFGNNSGDRTDLRVYRVSVDELLDEGNTSVQADTLLFAFADQTDFTPAWEATDWDLEAMIAVDDSLFLFTKNWLDERSHLYVMPSAPSTYLAVRRDTLLAQGLITGATLDPGTGAIALIGHTRDDYAPFVWRLSDYADHDLLGGVKTRHEILTGALQPEGIAWSAPDTVLFESEAGSGWPARLWRSELALSDAVVEFDRTTDLEASPCPVVDRLHLRSARNRIIRVTDMAGHPVLTWAIAAGDTFTDASVLRDGTYLLWSGAGELPVRIVVAR